MQVIEHKKIKPELTKPREIIEIIEGPVSRRTRSEVKARTKLSVKSTASGTIQSMK